MDGQAPPLDALALEPPAVAGEPQPSRSPTSEAEGGPPSGTVDQAPPLDGFAVADPATFDDELLAEPQPLEAEGAQLDAVNAAASSGAPEDGGGGVVLTDELRDQIVKQVEYYFCDENLPNDKFMLKYVKKNKEGFVPIGVIASFRRMKKLVQGISTIEAALRTSSKLVVSSDGKMVRRLHPLPHNDLKDPKKSTVVVDNLPSGFSVESIQEIFGTVGKIVNVTINGPPLAKDSATTNIISSSKVHALVEYETVEAAEKAVTTLSDETNWRTGMKVRLLAKQSVKHNQSSKENQDSVSAKKNQNSPSKEEQHATSEKNTGANSVEGAKENLNSDLTPEDEHQQQKPNGKGGRKGRYRGQGKGQGQIQQYTNKQGSSGSESLNKPIPGPRMPDGTRGFTMGRGRSLPVQKSEKAEE